MINLHAIYSRILANLLVKLTRRHPKVRGGGIGAPGVVRATRCLSGGADGCSVLVGAGKASGLSRA